MSRNEAEASPHPHDKRARKELRAFITRSLSAYEDPDASSIRGKFYEAGLLFEDGTIGRISRLTGFLGLRPMVRADWIGAGESARQMMINVSVRPGEFTQQAIHLEGVDSLWESIYGHLDEGRLGRAISQGVVAAGEEMQRLRSHGMMLEEPMSAVDAGNLQQRIRGAVEVFPFLVRD